MTKKIGVSEIEDLAIGAAILATGGGGDPYIGKLMAIAAIEKYGPVVLLDPDEIPDDALIIPTAFMGAPTVMVERIPKGNEALLSLRLMEDYTKKKAYATMPIEAGGLNSTVPFIVAAHAGIPVVDADGMGRAFPELQMESFSVYGLSGSPIVMHDEKGNYVIANTIDNKALEWIARGITVRMGGVAHIAHYSMTGGDMKRTCIRNSPSLCLKIGKAIRQARQEKRNPFEALMEATEVTNYGKAIPLFKGKIVDVERRTSAGFAVGKVLIEGLDEFKNQTMKINFQNENLIASINDRIVAMVPDLITIMDQQTGFAITTETLRYGFRVTVVGIPTPEVMRTEEAIATWGPKYFGYDLDYVPLELLHKDYYSKTKLSPEKEEKYRSMLHSR